MADYKLQLNGVLRTVDGAHIPDSINNRDWKEYQEWLGEGNTPDPADPSLPPLTTDEIYDTVIQNQKVLKAVVLALNDGSFIPGDNLTNAQLKTIIKAKI